MVPFKNFEVLSCISKKLSLYEVKNVITRDTYFAKILNNALLQEEEVEILTNMINKRKEIQHPNLIKFHDFSRNDETSTIHILMESCPKGNLADFIEKTKRIGGVYLSEEFLCKILHQILLILKTTNVTGDFDINQFYLDDSYNIKFINFDFDHINRNNDPKCVQMADVGKLLLQLASLNTANDQDKDLNRLDSVYSNDFITTVDSMLHDQKSATENIDWIFCHPFVLQKMANSTTDNIFFCKNPPDQTCSIMDGNIQETYKMKLQNLRTREAALRNKEDKLDKWEHSLNKREKKVLLMEQTAKDKLAQAELYLKRCREVKSTSSGSNKSGALKSSTNLYENDSFSGDYRGDSIILETSKKLDLTKRPFTRALSERKVRFKGHSPLKNMAFKSKVKQQPPLTKNTTLDTKSPAKVCVPPAKVCVPPAKVCIPPAKVCVLHENRPKQSKNKLGFSMRKKSKKFGGIITNDKENVGPETLGCRPISWTEESKKHAFDLLRIMNNASERFKCEQDVQHTYL